MGSKLALMLANIWMKMFEKSLGGDIPDDPSDMESGELLADTTSSLHRNPCGKFGTRVTRRRYSVQCNRCAFWYHRQCTELTVVEIKRMVEGDWNCSCRVARGVITQPIPEKWARLFASYVDDIIRTVKIADVDDMMEHANRLHPNLEFTMEMQSDGRQAFSDMLIDNNEGRLTTQWYISPQILDCRLLIMHVPHRATSRTSQREQFIASTTRPRRGKCSMSALLRPKNSGKPISILPIFTMPLSRRSLKNSNLAQTKILNKKLKSRARFLTRLLTWQCL